MIRKALSIFVLILFPVYGVAQQESFEFDFGEELIMIYDSVSHSLGGKEAWENLETVYAEGTWKFPHGEERAFIFKSMYPDLARFDFRVEESSETISKYGKRGWLNDPEGMIENYDRFDEMEKIVARNVFLYENNFVDFEKKGLVMKFEGTVVISGEEVWLVRIGGFPDKEELYYISKDDFKPFIKQSYYFRRGRSGVVNYYIKRYMNVDGVEMPREILVTSQDLNIILNFSSYVFNNTMDKDDFKDPNEPDFTTNTLSFNREKAQDYLHSEIPITRKMGIEVQKLTTNEVKLKAPIALNINHMKSAFGGSVDSLFLTAGWSYIRLVVDHFDPLPLIIGNKARTTFQRPITDDFSAQILIPDKKEVDKFLDEYKRFGKARISLEAVIEEDGKTYAVFKGDYVVVKEE